MEKSQTINQLPLKIFLFLVLNDLLDAAGQLLMKKGLGTGDLTSVGVFFQHLFNFSNPDNLFFWLGLLVYVSNFILWMNILSAIDLSVALPLASSSYIVIPIAAVVFLHEHVPPLRWLGLMLIVAGIYFISMSKPSKDSP